MDVSQKAVLTYHLINNREDLCRLIWDREQEAPQWYVDAGKVWHPTFESFEAFWQGCSHVHGLFDDDKLRACVYIEQIAPKQVNVHVSVIDKVPEADLVRWFQSLVRQHVGEGVEVITGWMLDKNRGLRRTAEKAGFQSTGLEMAFGQSRGKVLRWLQVRCT